MRSRYRPVGMLCVRKRTHGLGLYGEDGVDTECWHRCCAGAAFVLGWSHNTVKSQFTLPGDAMAKFNKSTDDSIRYMF